MQCGGLRKGEWGQAPVDVDVGGQVCIWPVVLPIVQL